MQLVLPEAFWKQALQGCHDDLDHFRIEWTIDLSYETTSIGLEAH